MSLNSSFPLIFLRLNVSQSLHQHRINQYLGLNQQLFDLGVPAMDLSSQNIVDVSSMRIHLNTSKNSLYIEVYILHEMNTIALYFYRNEFKNFKKNWILYFWLIDLTNLWFCWLQNFAGP